MLSQIAAAFRLQQGHQVTDLDEELIFSPFLGRKRASVALGSELLEAVARHFVALQPGIQIECRSAGVAGTTRALCGTRCQPHWLRHKKSCHRILVAQHSPPILAPTVSSDESDRQERT